MNTTKPHHNEQDDSRLKATLRAWQVNEALPPRFEENVWKRIEAAETSPVVKTNWLMTLLMRPAFAVVAAGFFVATGLIIGIQRANHDSAQWDHELGQRYVLSVDPYMGQR